MVWYSFRQTELLPDPRLPDTCCGLDTGFRHVWLWYPDARSMTDRKRCSTRARLIPLAGLFYVG